MKFNFRKIASVLASTVMLSSTVAIAAASTLPAPFVNNGAADAAIVYGTNPLASPTDMAAVTNIQSYLASKVSAQTGMAASTVTPSQGEVISLNKENTKIDVGSALNVSYTQLDSDKLPTILADGTYTDDNGNEFDYQQKINLGAPTFGLYTTNNNSLSADDAPVLGFNLASGTHVMNYSLSFNTEPTFDSSMAGTDLEILGKSYYVLQIGSTGKITLLDSANSIVLNSGDSKTVTIGGKSYDVSLSLVTSDSARLVINGVTTKSLKEGQTQKLPDGTYVGIKTVSQTKQGSTDQVEFSLGAGELVLQNGQNVELNGNSVNGLTSYITNSTTLHSVTLSWDTDQDEDLVTGTDVTMPGFGAIKLSMAGFVGDNNQSEKFSVKNNGNSYIGLTGVDTHDGSVDLPLLYVNSSKTGFKGLGKDVNNQLVTAGQNPTLTLNESANTEFVASYASGDTYETYVLKLNAINKGTNGIGNTTEFTDVADSSKNFKITDDGDKDIGNMHITLSNVDPDHHTVTVSLSGNAYSDRVYTVGGLRIMLPTDKSTNVAGDLNLSTTPASYTMNMTETDNKNNVAAGSTFNVTMAGSSDGPTVSNVPVATFQTDSGSNDFVGYVSGFHGAKLIWRTGGNQDTVDISYNPNEAYADVYVAEAGAVFSGSSSGGSTSVPLLKDTDVTDSTANNLVVVGGSCVNTVAASLLGLTYPACGDSFQTATGVGAGSYLIQTFSRSNGKVATLVAGYNADDTTNAAMAFKSQSIDTTAGKKYTGTTGTTVSLVTS